MSTDTPPPSSEPKARQTTIRSKLLAALALPVLAVALITGFQANNAQGDLNRTKDQVELALSAGGPTSYLSALLYERNETALYMLGLDKAISLGGVTSVPEARRETDKAKKVFDAAIASKNAQVRGLFADAQAQSAAKLSSVRNLADADTGTRGSTNASVVPVYDTYSAVIQTLIDANFNVVAQIDDAKLHNYAHSIAEYTKSTNLDSLMLRQVVLPKITGEPADTFTTGHMLTESDLTQQQLITDLEADPAAHKVV